MKLLEENLGENFYNLGLSKIFLDTQPEKIDKLSFIQIKHFCSWKHTVNRMKRKGTDWERNLHSIYLIKSFYPEDIKNSQNSMMKNERLIFKMDRDFPGGSVAKDYEPLM